MVTKTLARDMRERIRTRNLSSDARYPIRLVLADNSVYPYRGRTRFVDREINPNTGSLLIQTIFPNPDRLIRPGQFAKVLVTIDYIEEGMLIPQRCVSEFQGRQNVYVVDDSSRVEVRQLELGGAYKDYWIVLDGLEPSERIIYEGIQKVGSGRPVDPKLHQFVSQVSE
jgi:membrane fusion protein (multidrug efflux system)